MKSNEAEKITAETIWQSFDLEKINSDDKLMEKIRELLINKIELLLTRDFEKLIAILYRIDVSEEKAKAALVSEKNRAAVLADLIIERQIQKAKLRIE
ncbi:MAG: hypothetical protein ABIQ74_01450 [Chitinophagales bacterium]